MKVRPRKISMKNKEVRCGRFFQTIWTSKEVNLQTVSISFRWKNNLHFREKNYQFSKWNLPKEILEIIKWGRSKRQEKSYYIFAFFQHPFGSLKNCRSGPVILSSCKKDYFSDISELWILSEWIKGFALKWSSYFSSLRIG